jgi:hypothetical protein
MNTKSLIQNGHSRNADFDLESLHKKCRKWLSELGFWQDEMSFLNKLINQIAAMPTNRNQDIELQFFNGKLKSDLLLELSYLKGKIREIEFLFANALKYPSVINEERYQSEFRFLTTRIRNFREEMSEMKKDLIRLKKEARNTKQ